VVTGGCHPCLFLFKSKFDFRELNCLQRDHERCPGFSIKDF
jgi:hypothetical protein